MAKRAFPLRIKPNPVPPTRTKLTPEVSCGTFAVETVPDTGLDISVSQ